MIQYPIDLPYPEYSGYGFQSVDPAIRTQLITGRARTRRNYRSVPTMGSVSWSMSSPQAQLFESWFEEVLISGTQWFEIKLPTPQGPSTLCKAKFNGIYSGPSQDGPDQWRFTAILEVFERPILLGGWALYAPQWLLFMKEFDVAMNRDWPEA